MEDKHVWCLHRICLGIRGVAALWIRRSCACNGWLILLNPGRPRTISPPPGLEPPTSERGPREEGPEDLQGHQEHIQRNHMELELQYASPIQFHSIMEYFRQPNNQTPRGMSQLHNWQTLVMQLHNRQASNDKPANLFRTSLKTSTNDWRRRLPNLTGPVRDLGIGVQSRCLCLVQALIQSAQSWQSGENSKLKSLQQKNNNHTLFQTPSLKNTC